MRLCVLSLVCAYAAASATLAEVSVSRPLARTYQLHGEWKVEANYVTLLVTSDRVGSPILLQSEKSNGPCGGQTTVLQ